MTTTAPQFTVVTGASAGYGRCLWQFLRSAERRRLPAGHRFIAYDLGLAPQQRAALGHRFPWCQWRELPFAALPAHVAPGQRTYAWKPLAVHATAREFGGLVLWLDSATLFRTSLDEPLAMVRRYGVYTLAGQTALQGRCDPEIWRAMSAPLEILHRPERAAGVIGLDYTQPVARDLLDQWCALALEPRFWRPLSARHRPEQALWSILIYQAAARGELELNPGEIDISSPDPVRWLSTRNKVPAWCPTLVDPLVCAYYASYKFADRLVLRGRRFWNQRVAGLHRWPQDHYRVFTQISPDPAVIEVRAPRGSYYADPFPWMHEGQPWLFVEEFRYWENAGRLVALPLTDEAVARVARPLRVAGGHLSFPFLFEHGGELFLLPESSQARTVDLYGCEQFPDRWRLRRRLLADVDAADSILVRHADRWWLFTAVRDRGAQPRHLAIFHTDDLLAGEWQPHPVNAGKLYADRPYGTGRCAGGIVRLADGTLLRPVHWNQRHYGEGTRLMRIAALTPDVFSESEFTNEHPLGERIARWSPHHLATCGDLTAWDVRDRVSYWDRVPWVGRRFCAATARQNAATRWNFRAGPDAPRG
ncbi:MAG TPA: hypothetical protein VMC06_13860 [Opitutaceae bacterium]|nr:hypothetical protein [Opitutaceae bacterium]